MKTAKIAAATQVLIMEIGQELLLESTKSNYEKVLFIAGSHLFGEYRVSGDNNGKILIRRCN